MVAIVLLNLLKVAPRFHFSSCFLRQLKDGSLLCQTLIHFGLTARLAVAFVSWLKKLSPENLFIYFGLRYLPIDLDCLFSKFISLGVTKSVI